MSMPGPPNSDPGSSPAAGPNARQPPAHFRLLPLSLTMGVVLLHPMTMWSEKLVGPTCQCAFLSGMVAVHSIGRSSARSRIPATYVCYPPALVPACVAPSGAHAAGQGPARDRPAACTFSGECAALRDGPTTCVE